MANATAAVAIAHELGLSAGDIAKGLAAFGGVKRRFTHIGSWQGVEIYDDYAHHPVEIKSVLSAARGACSGRVIAISQPHRYTRLESLFDDFAACYKDADVVAITPVFAAGEEPIEGVSADELVLRILAGGHRDARVLEGPETLAQLVASEAQEGDVVICLGAGSITGWAAALPEELVALDGGGS